MREILFRGFHECSDGDTVIFANGEQKRGKWVYGLPHKMSKNIWFMFTPTKEIKTVLNDEGKKVYDVILKFNEVIPETVGQYTGRDAYLKSKEIVQCKLFEGDICEVTVFDHNGIDTQHICKIEYLGGSFYFVGTDKYDFYLTLSDVDDTESDVEIIGTIYDKKGQEWTM